MTIDAGAVGAAGLVILAVALFCIDVIIDRRMRAILETQRRIHQQQANIISMLLRAGFRGPRADPDWGDSGHHTRVAGTDR